MERLSPVLRNLGKYIYLYLFPISHGQSVITHSNNEETPRPSSPNLSSVVSLNL